LPPRPAWLLARPIPLRERVARIIAGPERIESGWWDGADMRRDYYVIETASCQRAWAFRPAGEDGPFMLQGWFA
jgi:protein ImuB